MKKRMKELESIIVAAFWEKLRLENDIRDKQIKLLGVTSKILRFENKLNLLREKNE